MSLLLTLKIFVVYRNQWTFTNSIKFYSKIWIKYKVKLMQCVSTLFIKKKCVSTLKYLKLYVPLAKLVTLTPILTTHNFFFFLFPTRYPNSSNHAFLCCLYFYIINYIKHKLFFFYEYIKHKLASVRKRQIYPE